MNRDNLVISNYLLLNTNYTIGNNNT